MIQLEFPFEKEGIFRSLPARSKEEVTDLMAGMICDYFLRAVDKGG